MFIERDSLRDLSSARFPDGFFQGVSLVARHEHLDFMISRLEEAAGELRKIFVGDDDGMDGKDVLAGDVAAVEPDGLFFWHGLSVFPVNLRGKAVEQRSNLLRQGRVLLDEGMGEHILNAHHDIGVAHGIAGLTE